MLTLYGAMNLSNHSYCQPFRFSRATCYKCFVLVGKTQVFPYRNSLTFRLTIIFNHPTDGQVAEIFFFFISTFQRHLRNFVSNCQSGFLSISVVAYLCYARLLWCLSKCSVVNNRDIKMFHYFTKCFTTCLSPSLIGKVLSALTSACEIFAHSWLCYSNAEAPTPLCDSIELATNRCCQDLAILLWSTDQQ